MSENEVPVKEDLTKEDLRQILSHIDEKGKALVLLLASSGMRVGEALSLKVDDLKLDEDPPQAWIQPGMRAQGRMVGMTYEARDAIRQWLKAKPEKRKPSGEAYSLEKVFDITYATARQMWSHALVKAGLDRRDPITKIHIHHLHTLREFFLLNIVMEMDTGVAHALIGHHLEYLVDVRRWMTDNDIMAKYKKVIGNLSLYGENEEDEEEQIPSQEGVTRILTQLKRGL